MLLIYAAKNQLTVRKRELITSGSVNVYTARFEFSPDWDNMERVAVFKADKESRSVLLGKNGECNIPWEVLEKPDIPLLAGVYGTYGGEMILPTIWANLGDILEGVTTGTDAQPPTPNLWEQQLASKGNALNYDGLNLSLMSGDKPLSTVQIAGGGDGGYVPVPGPQGPEGPPGPQGETGPAGPQGPQGPQGEPGPQGEQGIPGKDGEPGPAGQDGFSPTVSVAEINSGHQVTITDANGPKSFDVMDGKDGADGPQGPPGEKGETGPQGIQGVQGLQGPAGDNGIGVPEGGTEGQVLAKASDEDYDTYWIDPPKSTGSSGTVGTTFLVNAPIGTVVAWSGTADTIPEGWSACDGTNGTLDLRDKFILGAGDNHAIGATGGEETHTLTVDEMPEHNHSAQGYITADVASGSIGNTMRTSVKALNTGKTGNSNPHNNMPPYYTLLYIQKTGDTPTDYVTSEDMQNAIEEALSGIDIGGSSPYAIDAPKGTIVIWSGSEEDIPNGWALCDGENGTPDLRGKFVLGATNELDEEGNTAHPIGEEGGEETHTLSSAEMPKHRHQLPAKSSSGTYACVTTASASYTSGYNTLESGGSSPHNNMPPYYALCYIMKISSGGSSGGSSGVSYALEEQLVGVGAYGEPVYRKHYIYDLADATASNITIDTIKDIGNVYLFNYNVLFNNSGMVQSVKATDCTSIINDNGRVQVYSKETSKKGVRFNITIEYSKKSEMPAST